MKYIQTLKTQHIKHQNKVLDKLLGYVFVLAIVTIIVMAIYFKI
jgi:hypothetical protein